MWGMEGLQGSKRHNTSAEKSAFGRFCVRLGRAAESIGKEY